MAPPQNVVPSQSGAFVQYYAPADGGNGLQTVTMQPLQTSLAIQQPQVLVSRHALGPQAGAQNHQNGQQHGGQKAKKQRHNKQHWTVCLREGMSYTMTISIENSGL